MAVRPVLPPGSDGGGSGFTAAEMANGPFGQRALLMKLTRKGKALYMHCLPADITGLNCKAGEVTTEVFDRCKLATYREAEHKLYVIAAMTLLARFEDVPGLLGRVLKRGAKRRL